MRWLEELMTEVRIFHFKRDGILWRQEREKEMNEGGKKKKKKKRASKTNIMCSTRKYLERSLGTFNCDYVDSFFFLRLSFWGNS